MRCPFFSKLIIITGLLNKIHLIHNLSFTIFSFFMLGFGICLTAETTTGVFYSGEAVSPVVPPGGLPCVPEELGREAAMKLLDEINR